MVMTFSHFRPGEAPTSDLFYTLGHFAVSQIDAVPDM